MATSISPAAINTGTTIATQGGAYIEGPVEVHNGDFIGRDFNLGYTPEQLRGLMADQRSERQSLQAELTDLRVRLGVTDQALGTFFTILEQQVPPEQWPARLPEIALRHRQALDRLAALEAEDPEAARLLQEARAAVEVGDYERSERLLDKAEGLELAGIRAAEELEQKAREAVARRRLSAAAVRSEKAEVFLIQLRYLAAAEQFAAAAGLVPDSQPEQRLAYLDRHADALYRQGHEKGDNGALKEAIRVYQDLLAERPRERVPLDWAMTQNNLGNALWTLGEREPGTARLEEAVAAYRAALEE